MACVTHRDPQDWSDDSSGFLGCTSCSEQQRLYLAGLGTCTDRNSTAGVLPPDVPYPLLGPHSP